MSKARGGFRGQDFSVFNPVKVRQGLRLWTEAVLRSLAQRQAGRQEQPEAEE